MSVIPANIICFRSLCFLYATVLFAVCCVLRDKVLSVFVFSDWCFYGGQLILWLNVIFSFNLPSSSCCARLSQTNAAMPITKSQTPKKMLYQHNIVAAESCSLDSEWVLHIPFLSKKHQHMDSAQRLQKEAILRFNIFSQTV